MFRKATKLIPEGDEDQVICKSFYMIHGKNCQISRRHFHQQKIHGFEEAKNNFRLFTDIMEN